MAGLQPVSSSRPAAEPAAVNGSLAENVRPHTFAEPRPAAEPLQPRLAAAGLNKGDLSKSNGVKSAGVNTSKALKDFIL